MRIRHSCIKLIRLNPSGLARLLECHRHRLVAVTIYGRCRRCNTAVGISMRDVLQFCEVLSVQPRRQSSTQIELRIHGARSCHKAIGIHLHLGHLLSQDTSRPSSSSSSARTHTHPQRRPRLSHPYPHTSCPQPSPAASCPPLFFLQPSACPP